MFSSKWKWNHFALCGFRLPQKSRKVHKSSTIEIVNSGILSDRCHYHCHCHIAEYGRARVSEWIYVDEFCVRKNVFIFRSPFFSLSRCCCMLFMLIERLLIQEIQIVRLTLCHWMMCDFLYNRVCTHTQNQIDNDFRRSIITFLL